jgi:hypothetical protein
VTLTGLWTVLVSAILTALSVLTGLRSKTGGVVSGLVADSGSAGGIVVGAAGVSSAGRLAIDTLGVWVGDGGADGGASCANESTMKIQLVRYYGNRNTHLLFSC